jgi:hypothetical protein
MDYVKINTQQQQVEALLANIVPQIDIDKVINDIQKLRITKSCLNGLDLNKNMCASGSLWGYFPHFMDVSVSGRSLADKLNNPTAKSQLIAKTIAYCNKYENEKISKNRVFQSLKAYNGHHVSNFRPSAAKDLYLDLVGKNAAIFDPCAGWGGRLLGALGAECTTYVGVDASIKTVNGFNQLIYDLNLDNCSMQHDAIEDLIIKTPFADIAFTSPPYFNAEEYSLDTEQSCVRYKSYAEWTTKFLAPLCLQMSLAIDIGGYVAINIADTKKYQLCEDTNKYLANLGLRYEKTYRYIMSSIAGKGIKFENIYVYKKIGAVKKVKDLFNDAIT